MPPPPFDDGPLDPIDTPTPINPVTPNIPSVPEPGTLIIGVSGLIAYIAGRRLRRPADAEKQSE